MLTVRIQTGSVFSAKRIVQRVPLILFQRLLYQDQFFSNINFRVDVVFLGNLKQGVGIALLRIRKK